ncbi:germin, RmlC-like cupin domain protein [Tanacetum coccineum]
MVKAEDFLFRGLDKMEYIKQNAGDVFVFPQGLIHFQQNVGNGYALAIAALSSQNPGAITIADAVFGSNPDISDDILAKAFQVDKKVIDDIQSNF